MTKVNKHDKLVNIIFKTLEDKEIRFCNVEYNFRRITQSTNALPNPRGEIDVGYYDNLVLGLYEVKSTLRGWKKANQQLRRAEKEFVPRFEDHWRVEVEEIPLYIAYYEGMKHIVERIK